MGRNRRIARAAVAVLVLCALTAAQAQAAGTKQWVNGALHLAVTYPGDWRVVPERGAALKLVAPDAHGEFEIFALPRAASTGSLVARSDAELARLHCGIAIRHTSPVIGHLGVAGRLASAACTGADRGWQLTVTTFQYRSATLLLRSWLFHGQPRDNVALMNILSSLAPRP